MNEATSLLTIDLDSLFVEVTSASKEFTRKHQQSRNHIPKITWDVVKFTINERCYVNVDVVDLTICIVKCRKYKIL